jgi:hypothetical protein
VAVVDLSVPVDQHRCMKGGEREAEGPEVAGAAGEQHPALVGGSKAAAAVSGPTPSASSPRSCTRCRASASATRQRRKPSASGPGRGILLAELEDQGANRAAHRVVGSIPLLG